MDRFISSFCKSFGVMLVILGVSLSAMSAYGDGPSGDPGGTVGCLWLFQCSTFNGVTCPGNSCVLQPFCVAIGGYPEGSRCCCNWRFG